MDFVGKCFLHSSREGLLVFRAQMGIRINGILGLFSLLSEVEMGSHLLANVL